MTTWGCGLAADQRSDRKAARTSVVKSSGSSALHAWQCAAA